MNWYPIATAPKDGTVYLATDWTLFSQQNHPLGFLPGDWVADGIDWKGTGDYQWATHWSPIPMKPKNLL